jgi:hypothetical protein
VREVWPAPLGVHREWHLGSLGFPLAPVHNPPPRVFRWLPYIYVPPSMQYNHPISVAYTFLHILPNISQTYVAVYYTKYIAY